VLRRLAIYLLLICAIFLPWMAWETDRNMVRRWLYPVTGQLAAWSTRCDASAPPWMKDAAGGLAKRFASPTNQLVLVDAAGQRSGCVNGWWGLPFFSPRTTADTRFRLASLSKIVSFMGLVQPQVTGGTPWLDDALVDDLKLPGPYKDPRVAQIRIRHLLNHSAGFDRMRTADPMVIDRKTPWCPGDVALLARTPLQFDPGSRYAYANLGYCLAAAAYERRFGSSLWDGLERDLHLSRHGIDYLYRADAAVAYNFMHHEVRGPDFTENFDWRALRGSMGMTGNAQGLADLVTAHRPLLDYARAMHEPAVRCNESVPESCQDGFLERRRVGDALVWVQRGYLYGMSALFLTDAAGNFLVWLGAGDMPKQPLKAFEFLEQAFLRGAA